MKNVTLKKIYGVLISFKLSFQIPPFYVNLKMINYYGSQLPLKRELNGHPHPSYQVSIFYLAGRIKALVLEFGGLVILSSVPGPGITETKCRNKNEQ